MHSRLPSWHWRSHSVALTALGPHLAAFTCLSLSDHGSHVFGCSLGARQWAEPLLTALVLLSHRGLREERGGAGRGGEGRGEPRLDAGPWPSLPHPPFLGPRRSPSQPCLRTHPLSDPSLYQGEAWWRPLCWRGSPWSLTPHLLPPDPKPSPCPPWPVPYPEAPLAWVAHHTPQSPSQASSGALHLLFPCLKFVPCMSALLVNSGVGSHVPRAVWPTRHLFPVGLPPALFYFTT